jgi:hypothetical protein
MESVPCMAGRWKVKRKSTVKCFDRWNFRVLSPGTRLLRCQHSPMEEDANRERYFASH